MFGLSGKRGCATRTQCKNIDSESKGIDIARTSLIRRSIPSISFFLKRKCYQCTSIRKQMPEAPAPGAPAPGAPAAAQGVGSANDAREVEQESASEVPQRAREVEQENASEASQRAREVERSQKPTTEGQGQQSNEKKDNTELSLSQSSV